MSQVPFVYRDPGLFSSTATLSDIYQPCGGISGRGTGFTIIIHLFPAFGLLLSRSFFFLNPGWFQQFQYESVTTRYGKAQAHQN
jgi:hypothetical protein